ncbi:SpoIID/LytB domain-containing protein [Caldibacillus lycopersici]|uniref:SpoIID/LytB domain-containing protein n=1 Tax=Perspicuibacillus lycopersici TaxID=1325689 RepID=A0AAE3IUF9_9BACI|nr:SpoIID/LytB domain-containing protein [Perspicuibacillus lycopersici]MCU9613803.1 SpoIID/LytB domain-containing protein [Perspicuibacillus lycopersici]
MKTLTLIIFTFLSLTFANEVFADEMISVRLKNYIGNTSKISFHFRSDYLTLDPTVTLKDGVDYTLTLKNGKLFLQFGKTITEVAEPFILYPADYDEEHLLFLEDRPYLGAIEFHIEDGKYIRPINQLLLEDYLMGVVPFEVYPSWGLEALKAQTLAARTYTVTHQSSNLDDTTHYQVYGGYNTFEKTKQAVKETNGEIITFKGKPINAYYSASNGGMTESNRNVWGGKQSSYFPIKQDPYDPVILWDFSLKKTQIDLDEINWSKSNWWEELQEKDVEITSTMKNWLNQHGYPGDIKILSIPTFVIAKDKNEAQRSLEGSIEITLIRKVMDDFIFFEKVSFHHVPLKKIRPLIGASYFKSYLISSFENEPSAYNISGKGNGHGVGMSQWGANVMAEAGKTYKEIIDHYYPGTEVKLINQIDN